MGRPVKPFWSQVHFGPACWEWMGAKIKHGYGSKAHEGTVQLAHRITWQMENGPIPTGMHVCHHCDNPPAFALTTYSWERTLTTSPTRWRREELRTVKKLLTEQRPIAHTGMRTMQGTLTLADKKPSKPWCGDAGNVPDCVPSKPGKRQGGANGI